MIRCTCINYPSTILSVCRKYACSMINAWKGNIYRRLSPWFSSIFTIVASWNLLSRCFREIPPLRIANKFITLLFWVACSPQGMHTKLIEFPCWMLRVLNGPSDVPTRGRWAIRAKFSEIKQEPPIVCFCWETLAEHVNRCSLNQF